VSGVSRRKRKAEDLEQVGNPERGEPSSTMSNTLETGKEDDRTDSFPKVMSG
jgi:hypothetical protein